MTKQGHDIRRLPVWAQDNIRALAQEILELRGQIDQLRGSVGASNVFVGGTLPEDREIPLGMNTRIRFQMPKPQGRVTQRFIDVRHERKHDDNAREERDAIVVQGDGTILIEAHATNSLRLILER